MDEFELKRILYDYMKEICHYSQMQVFATSTYQRNYFQLQIDEAMNELVNFIQSYHAEAVYAEQLYDVRYQQTQQNMQGNQDIRKNTEPMQIQQPEQNQTAAQKQPENISPEEPNLRVITKEELADNDGSGGKSAYVAVDGKVYDVTDAIRWAGGTHFGQYAGKDLTNEFMICHNGMFSILNILHQIGTLEA